MKKVFHKIMSITLALLLLVSTTSWKVEKHYCLGHIVDISFFTPAEGCGMEMEGSDNTASMESQNSCCSDVTMVMQGQDDLSISYNNFNFLQQLFFVAFTASYLHLIEPDLVKFVQNSFYPPPIIVKDIQLLDKVFLI